MGNDVSLPLDRMPEAEVALRLAFHLLNLPDSEGLAEVAVDGAMVRVGDKEIFPIAAFIATEGWGQTNRIGKNSWQGFYEKGRQRLKIHATAGVGDVVTVVDSKRIRAECKGGPLIKKPGSREHPILRQTLGQLLTVEEVADHDVMVAAVPLTPVFSQLAAKWRTRPLVARSEIKIVLVGRDGTVEGLNL